jgi:hypothetical protein
MRYIEHISPFLSKRYDWYESPSFSCQSIGNILACVLELGETAQWPITEGINGSAEN